MTKNKYILMSIFVIFLGLSVAGGTYAYLTTTLNTTNSIYNVGTHCFLVDYNINNTDNSQNITGTMFPSSSPSGGLNGRVGLKLSDSCNVTGTATLKLHINSGTSSKFGTVGAAHCENPNTLETLHDYGSSSACSGHGTWTSSSTVLKYAIYDNAEATGNPVSKGYITTSDIGSDKTIQTDIPINRTNKYYYIYIWLDGYLTDNTYTELPFSGYISASATQSESGLPSGYQQVEYIASSGTQYINTGLTGHMNYKYEITFQQTNTANSRVWGVFGQSSYVGPNMSVTWNTIRAVRWESESSKQRLVDNIDTINTNLHNIVIDNGQVYYDNQNKGKSAGHSDSYVINKNIYLFTANPGDAAVSSNMTGKIYLYKVWDNTGKLIQNFIPCYKTSGTVIGMYDIMNGVFYENAGTGSFTKGSNV